ncbi:MAG: response regulator [Bacilli bacterium]|nr:response regulator [Bacilli bacterium]
MGIGFYLSLSMLPVMTILAFIFLLKKKINNEETKIYSYLLITSIAMSFFEVLSALLYKNYFDSLVYGVVAKLVLICYLIVFFLFGKYNMTICKRPKNRFFILYAITAVVVLITTITSTNFVESNGTVAPQGVPIVLTFSYSICLSIYELILSIINGKNIVKKKFTPVYFLFLLGTINTIIIYIYPTSFMVGYIICLVIIIMNFTIENPDVKMLKQVELAKESADKANAAKTDFLSSMSHEIRTPLNAIVGFSDEIMECNNLDEAKENAKDIVNASQTLLEIVNGILDISKIEAGKLEIVNSPYDANNTFNELAKLISPKMKEKGLDFSFNIAPDLPKTLYGDHANLKKVVTNLLSNACKYTDNGYVHYEVNCVNSNGLCKLIISVEDSGRGIKTENVDKLFTKFQRLEEDRNTTIEGTGLGLAITKQLVELMGGRIIVHTVYGEGSKFTIVLNQKITNDVVKEEKEVKTTLDLHDVKVLIVDDVDLNLKVAKKLLERYNANLVDICKSGFECLEKINNGEKYDLILLDDMMPKMSGVDTLKKLREIPGFRTPVIALTANAISGMKEKYLADGFDDYLAKPIEKDQLIRVFNEILGKSYTEELAIKEASENKLEEKKEELDKIVPVEENIEAVLGDKLDRNYVEPEEEIETLDVEDESVPETPEKLGREYLEANGVDVNHGLELLGDMDMYNMTINDFMAEVEDKWNRIVEYKNSGDMENYSIEVHSLKSDCKYLGFMTLADIAYQHELKSKENDSNYVNDNFKALEDEYHKVLEIASKYVESNPSSEE